VVEDRSEGHLPVMVEEVMAALSPVAGSFLVDATVGGGGHAVRILEATSPDGRLLGLDADPAAVARSAARLVPFGERVTLRQANFARLGEVAPAAGFEAVDGVLFDLGLSSYQLADTARGFSFRAEGPLDMRMSGQGPSAADLVNAASERDLANIIFLLGEERHSRSVARAIVKARQRAPIATTAALADLVASVVRARPGDIHPATRTFQALRIFVNDELGELAGALAAAERVLKPNGRLVVVSFHSLEDRIVKTFLAERSETRGGSRHAPEVKRPAPTFRVLTKRPLTADDDEIARNPRARSAKLRAGERTEAPARAGDLAALLPRLPSLTDVLKGR